ncbi:MAG: hypothetical protein ACE5J3_09255 [Methanosarcinales archaeon]
MIEKHNFKLRVTFKRVNLPPIQYIESYLEACGLIIKNFSFGDLLLGQYCIFYRKKSSNKNNKTIITEEREHLGYEIIEPKHRAWKKWLISQKTPIIERIKKIGSIKSLEEDEVVDGIDINDPVEDFRACMELKCPTALSKEYKIPGMVFSINTNEDLKEIGKNTFFLVYEKIKSLWKNEAFFNTQYTYTIEPLEL